MNRYAAVAVSCDSSCARFRVGRGGIAARPWAGVRRGQRVPIAVREEDVLLCAAHPGRVSARNVLAGTVRSVRLAPGCAFVRVDVGFPLVALITRQARAELALLRGSRVFAVVKATAVVPEPGPAGRLRFGLSLGSITPDRFRFLEAVRRTGTLLAAAQVVRVTYRTAWLWAREINRAAGRPVLVFSRGGRGGGGAALTLEGLRLLAQYRRLADRISSG